MNTKIWLDQLGPLAEVVLSYAARIGGVLFVLFVVHLVAGWVKRKIIRVTEARGIDTTIGRFSADMARFAIVTGAVLGCLGVFGIETASFAAVFAAMGLALGLALQGTLGNFAAGAMLLIFRPFKVGDVVVVAGHTGTVTELELFATEITTPDRRRLVVPNGKIFGDTIENITHHSTRRLDVEVGIDYGADMKRSREVLLKAAQSVSEVHADPAPAAILASLGDSALAWKVRVWCNTEDYWGVMEAVTEAVKRELDNADIAIPYPQMDVHMNDNSCQGSHSSGEKKRV